MIKYVDYKVTFAEVPDEISLCINLTNCPFRCKGCHSPDLREDKGIELTKLELSKIINANKGISCVTFMGGDNDLFYLIELEKFVKDLFNLKTCWYTGMDYTMGSIDYRLLTFLDYIKIGHYDEKKGPLTSKTTNQLFYKKSIDDIGDIVWQDVTFRFFKT